MLSHRTTMVVRAAVLREATFRLHYIVWMHFLCSQAILKKSKQSLAAAATVFWTVMDTIIICSERGLFLWLRLCNRAPSCTPSSMLIDWNVWTINCLAINYFRGMACRILQQQHVTFIWVSSINTNQRMSQSLSVASSSLVWYCYGLSAFSELGKQDGNASLLLLWWYICPNLTWPIFFGILHMVLPLALCSSPTAPNAMYLYMYYKDKRDQVWSSNLTSFFRTGIVLC